MLLLCCGLVLLSGADAGAQAVSKPRRVALLSPGSNPYIGLSRALAARGYEEGRNLVLEFRHGPAEAMPALAHELVSSKPDVIIAVSGALPHVRRATASIPIVSFGPDPVEQGFAESFSRPGGNVTGVGIFGAQLDGKRLELLSEAAPARRTAVLIHRATPSAAQSRREVLTTARQLGLEPLLLEVDGRADYEAAFDRMKAAGTGALVIAASAFFFEDRAALGELARAAGIATVCEWGELARADCTIGYGPLRRELYERVADLVSRIFQGARPGELPIERPDRFELVVNVKAANLLGLSIPPAVLARADEVIE